MHINDTVRALRRFWWLVAVVAVVVTATASLFLFLSRSYSTQVSVAVIGAEVVDSSTAVEVANYVRGEMTVYEAMLSTPEVLTRAVELSGLPIASTEAMADKMVVMASGQVIKIQYEGDSADDSKAGAKALAQSLMDAIDELHSESNTPILKTVLLTEVPAPAEVTSSTLRTLTTGLLLGLVLGVTAAVLLNYVRDRVGSAPELARVMDDLVLGEFPGAVNALEAGRRLAAVIETTGSHPERQVYVIAGAEDDDSAEPVARAVAEAFAEGSRLVSFATMGNDPSPVEANPRSDRFMAHTEGTSQIIIIAAPALTRSAQALWLAKQADRVLVTATVSDHKRTLLSLSDTLHAADASLIGFVVTRRTSGA